MRVSHNVPWKGAAQALHVTPISRGLAWGLLGAILWKEACRRVKCKLLLKRFAWGCTQISLKRDFYANPCGKGLTWGLCPL